MPEEERSEEYSEKMKNRLLAMREDYRLVTGASFKHFFCPILLRDEDTRLCMGHIINQKIANSRRKTVVQRHDVDSWYGRVVERDFINFNALQGHTIEEILLKKELRTKLRPRFARDGEECDYYPDKGKPAPGQTKMILKTPSGKEVKLILKMQPADLEAAASKKWQVAIEKDYRLPALVSVIKAAYLTLFSILGYRYALSAAGLEVGYYILGRFYLANSEKELDDVREEAIQYFSQYVHMLRPMQGAEKNLPQGTMEDNRITACYSINGKPFGAVVCVRTDTDRHAVLMPLFEDADSALLYWNFLRGDGETLFAHDCQFDAKNQRWLRRPERVTLTWPKKSESFKLS